MEHFPWPQIVIAVSTLIASILGFLLAGTNEARRDRRAVAREREARSEERRSVGVNARHEFQLDTLLTLQDALQLMARHTGRALHFDHMQAREGKQALLPDGYSEEMHASEVDVSRLRNRLLDSELRSVVEDFEMSCRRTSFSPRGYAGLEAADVEAHAESLYADLNLYYTRAMDRLGVTVRSELDWLPEVDRSHLRAHA